MRKPEKLTRAQSNAVDLLFEAFTPNTRRYLPPEFPRKMAEAELTRVPSEAEFKAAEKTLYYWWWRFLKESSEYPPPGKQKNRGPIGELYRDFGELGGNFRDWWARTGRFVFSEPEGTAVRLLYDTAWDGDDDEETAEILIVEVYKHLPRQKIEQDFRLLLKNHHPGAALRDHSHKRAKRRLYPRARKDDKAFSNVLESWRKKSKQDMKWTRIGRELPLNPSKKMKKKGVAADAAEMAPKHQNKRAHAYFTRAERLMHYAVRGDFPRET